VKTPSPPKAQRCAIYTRKSTEHNLDLAFNSLDAQREACEAYIKSQAHEGWKLIRTHFDDGGLSGASLDRPALRSLLDQVRAKRIDIVVVYKVDRLTRSLADFAKLVETFDEHEVSFVSVTQSFNTTSSMGRLTLNVLLSFAQFEREVIGERVRDKIAASTVASGMIAPASALTCTAPGHDTCTITCPAGCRVQWSVPHDVLARRSEPEALSKQRALVPQTYCELFDRR
jgi:predicted site-specific integrase-resolvase